MLATIFAAKALTLAGEREREPYAGLRARGLSRLKERRAFLGALQAANETAVIAEIKPSSPLAGTIATGVRPGEIARLYEEGGASAISVLTESRYFGGELAYLEEVRAACALPILRKDFLWDRYQIAQSAAYGADAVLLIIAGLNDEQLEACLDEAATYALSALIEVHDEPELNRAARIGGKLIGVNNRNLRTLQCDLATAERLIPQVPPRALAVAESGIRSAGDAARMRAAGARALLVGEALMRSDDPRSAIAEFRR